MHNSRLLPIVLIAGVFAANMHPPIAQYCLYSIPNLEVVTPSSSNYSAAKLPFNLRLSPNPAIIVTPSLVQQIRSIVICAVNAGLSVSAKSGGHSYAAYGLSGDVVVDLSLLKALTVDSSGKATVQTGNRLGELATGIHDQGQRALPHGTCPYVGSGGHTLYGGFGYFSRVGGLLLDRVVAAEVVLANGELVTANTTLNTDLFWAIRGGGPSFGIVTSWTFDTSPAPPTVINYRITFGTLSVTEKVEAFMIWQTFTTTVPNEMSMAMSLRPSNGSISLTFPGQYFGPRADFDAIITTLLSRLPTSASLSATDLDWIGGLESHAANGGTLNITKPDAHDTFFVKSMVTTGPSSAASITSLIEYLTTYGPSSGTAWFAQADRYGGAIASVAVDATAFAHRNAFLVFQLYASSSNLLPPYPANGVPFITDMLAALEPSPQGAYPNYIDPTLDAAQWRAQYFGKHAERLQRIKKRVDPRNVFKFPEGF